MNELKFRVIRTHGGAWHDTQKGSGITTFVGWERLAKHISGEEKIQLNPGEGIIGFNVWSDGIELALGFTQDNATS